MSAAVWSWADVPGLAEPPPARPVRPRRLPNWPWREMAEGEHVAAPAGKPCRAVQSVAAWAARRYGLRFAIHVTDAGVFVRRLPLGARGPGTETVWAPLPADSRPFVPTEAAS